MEDLYEGTLADLHTLMTHPPRLRAGHTEYITNLTAAAGASFTYPIGNSWWERIVGVAATLTTSATAGTRTLLINYLDGAGNTFSQAPVSMSVTPSMTLPFAADIFDVSPLTVQQSITAQGRVVDPGAFGGISFTSVLPAGQYTVTAQTYLDGTVAAGDQNNMEIAYGGASATVLNVPAVVNLVTSLTMNIYLPVAHAIGVQTIAAASGASAGYNASVVATATNPATAQILLPDLILKSGMGLQLQIGGVQAGDQLTGIEIVTERYASNYADGALTSDYEQLARRIARALAAGA